MLVKKSAHPFAETVDLLRERLEHAGNTVFAVIDQAAAAQGAGLRLRPTVLIIFGNPKAGTPLMDAQPLVGLDLPLKVQVWDEGGTVSVACVTMAEIAARYGLHDDARIATIDAALEKLTESIAA